MIALVILAAGGCLALGWWQWTRFQSTSGTFQNLGYAMQWPLFAWFCVYAYRKFVRYEEAPPEPQKDRAMTELPDGLLPAAAQTRTAAARRSGAARVQRLPRRARTARCRKDRTGPPHDHTQDARSAAGCTPVEKIRTALLGYRVMAWTTGIWLIALCYEIVVHYVVKVTNPPTWIGVVHGWVYFTYVLAAFNLAVKVRWPILQDDRRAVGRNHPAGRDHRRALPD